MATLKKYSAKRNPKKTPEPKAKVVKSTRGKLRFVIQKHAARRLHYDLRLENEGVMKSWAVPKGPSLDPNQKHLAMMVEDHPMDYRKFEGTIPKGQYGGGTVMVWDEGTYSVPGASTKAEAEKMIKQGLKKGHITFILDGKKLKGEFALIHMRNADAENAWLLVKKKDEFASKKDITKQNRSVKTDRTMDEIANG